VLDNDRPPDVVDKAMLLGSPTWTGRVLIARRMDWPIAMSYGLLAGATAWAVVRSSAGRLRNLRGSPAPATVEDG